MAQQGARPAGRRGQRARGLGAGKLAAIAVVVAVICMGSLTARAVVSDAACTKSPLLLNVAVSTDIDPAVAAVANSFNKQNAAAAGRCVQVQVTPTGSGTEAQVLEGRATAPGAPADAWIPDSSVWVVAARGFPAGAQALRSAGKSVARSPLMLVTTRKIAASTGIFASPASWNLLVPSTYGGPPKSMNVSVDLPDPSTSAAGLSSLIEVSRELQANPAGRVAIANFALTAQRTENFNSPAALAQFVQTTQPPLGSKAITVASEQAVLGYDKGHPASPLAAKYATSAQKSLATPELDYPYVVTTSQSARLQAARIFGSYLQTGYAQSLMRYHGFRSANGVPDVMPPSAGIASQPLQVASAASPTEVAASVQTWQKLGPSFRDLAIVDTSPAMAQPSGSGDLTNQQLVGKVADEGLPFFPDNAQLGLWETGNTQSASPPFTSLMPIGPLSASYGLIIRRTELQEATSTLQTAPAGKLALYKTILDAYQQMTRTYNPKTSNTIMVFTSGDDTATNDISLSTLLAALRKLHNPDRQVSVFILMFGDQGNLKAMQKIAKVTESLAWKITDPNEVGQLFFRAVSLRTCGLDCGSQ